MRRRHEVADQGRPGHGHNHRCKVQDVRVRERDRELELYDRVGEGDDVGEGGAGQEYGDCEGVVLAACEMYVHTLIPLLLFDFLLATFEFRQMFMNGTCLLTRGSFF